MPSFLIQTNPRGDFFHPSEMKDAHGKVTVDKGERVSLVPCADGTAGAIAGTDARTAGLAHGLAYHPCPAPPEAVQLRTALAAFRAELSPAQLANLWYPYREPVETALADADAGVLHSLDAAKQIIRTLPWVAGRDDAIKAAALALVGA